MRKKIAAIGLGVILAMQCMACGSSEAKETNDQSTTAPKTEAPTATPTVEPTVEPTLEATETPAAEMTEAPEAPDEAQTDAPEATVAPAETPASQTSNTGNKKISDKWTDMDFIFDGHKYTIPAPYKDLEANGWKCNLKDYGIADGYVLNPGDKVTGTIDLKNSKYNEDLSVNIGFYNDGKKAQELKKCKVWSFSIDTSYAFEKLKNIPDMEIAKGIKIGSTKEQVLKAFGKPEYEHEEKKYKYTTYEFQANRTCHLRITVYDKDGVTAIEYQNYK